MSDMKVCSFAIKNIAVRLVDRDWCGLAWVLGIRVSDPYFFLRIRIQHFRLNADPDPDPGFFYDQKLKKIYS
jgi:hypothetical protein